MALTTDAPAARGDAPPWATRIALALVLVSAFALRVWHLGAGAPFAVGVDEPHIINRALTILRTGDWNTHAFDYPALVIYVHAIAAIPWYLWGASRGLWFSLATVDVGALYAFERLVAAGIAVWTIWLVYRIGEELDSRWLGLLAAAQLAVLSLHVRESHFVLTDVPATALTTLTLLLAVRASRLRTSTSLTWAGAAAGFAASAKYNGGLVLVAPLIVWAGCAWPVRNRGRVLAVVVLAAAAAFVVGTPYGLLDLPALLNGYGAQMQRFAASKWDPANGPIWLVYYKHLARPLPIWIPLACAGLVLALLRSRSRLAWAAISGFGAVYANALASHSMIFARYALPLLPVLALAAAVPIVEMGRWTAGVQRGSVRRVVRWVAPVAAGAILIAFAVQSIQWVGQLDLVDTRTLAADWLKANAPRGAKVAVEEVSGPTHLEAAGLAPEWVFPMDEHPLEWYAERDFDFLVVSGGGPMRQASVFPSAPTVFTAAPDQTRRGPHIRIVKVR